MEWPQVKQPFTQSCLDYISSIDIHKDLDLLTSKLNFRKICIRNFIIAQLLLKKCALKNLTAFEIGSLLYQEDEDQISEIQSLVKKCDELKKMLKPQIIQNPSFLKIVNMQKEMAKKNFVLQKEGWEIIESNKFKTPLKQFRIRTVSDFYDSISEERKNKLSVHKDELKERNGTPLDNASTCDEWIEIQKPK
jgi:hypothetical protein